MRVSKVSITNLFGVFNHVIPLNQDDRITIIIGPNGFGKTALLRMLDGLFKRRFSAIRAIPFQDFQVDLDDGNSLRLTKKLVEVEGNGRGRPRDAELLVRLLRSGKEVHSTTQKPPHPGRDPFPLEIIELEIPELTRIGAGRWRFTPTGETLALEDVIERFGEILSPSLRRAMKEEKSPEWLDDFLSQVNVRFIETQRLLNIRTTGRDVSYERRISSERMVPAVEQYSGELARAIQTKLVESAALSQSLDRTFPARVVAQDTPSHLTDEQLREELAALECKRTHLTETGLLDTERDTKFQIPQQFDDRTKTILSVYVRDTEQKLGVFDDMAEKIDLLRTIVNRMFLYKTMSVSKNEGFTFATMTGNSLPSTLLSSGEQHELVLLYELLFKVKPGSLILIDEPELSLHVAWQEAFLRDLQEIARLSDFDVVVATHSPQIINDRWDLTVELKGPDL